ncbi:hypothetical protein FPV67DRAFT_308816 [Lyophyllum atratum]|nr:hypothetical protein FPV67DRAFT_308816 [Lyophyllum atratum]
MTRMILGPVLVVAFAALADARVLSQLDARAFTSSAVCKPEYSWTDNSQHVSPCNLAAVVLGACAGNNWNIAPLDGAHFYSIPAVVNNTVNLCSWINFVYHAVPGQHIISFRRVPFVKDSKRIFRDGRSGRARVETKYRICAPALSLSHSLQAYSG